MTDTTAVEVVPKTITEGKMNLTGTRTEIRGTDGVSPKVCMYYTVKAKCHC